MKFIDPCFAQNWLGTQRAGITRGAYHFFHANSDPIAQAKSFVEAVKPLLTGFDLPPALDIEYAPDMNSVTAFELMARAKQWLEYVEHELGVIPVIYTSQRFWEDYIGPNPVFAKYPLWLAAAMRRPGPPSAWQEWTFWQFSPLGKVPGIMTAVDLSYYGGDKKQFLQLLTEKGYPKTHLINVSNG
jgi:lysozyme